VSVLLHLSDTHFGTEQPPVVEALLRLAHDVRPDVAVLSGDVTQRARSAQFAAARRFTDALAAPATLVIPGNHDIPLFNLAARMAAPYANYRHAFGPLLEPQFSSDDLLVLCVNTTRPWRHKDGEVSAAQIDHVAQQLQLATPLQLRVVVVHQPLRVIRDIDRDNLLHGHHGAARIWTASGADLILSGHIHLPYVQPLHGPQTGSQRPAWAVSAGTAVSTRVREGQPNSVNLIRYDPQRMPRVCVVDRLDFDATSAKFITVKTTELSLA
jgi:3',5'-cyclic AMP phosphodiesterase CpdA